MNNNDTTARILAAFIPISDKAGDSDYGPTEVASIAPHILHSLGKGDLARAESWMRTLIQRMEDDTEARDGIRNATVEARRILDN